MSRLRAGVVIACVLAPMAAHAQPRNEKSGEKADAKALMASGLKLFTAKDYLGALAVFQEAYAKYPSAKILLNIATTQKALDRSADAANSYQRYLDSADADAVRKAEVQKVLAELDATLGILNIKVTPDEAELQIGTNEWRPASELHRVRVVAGPTVVRARLEKHKLGEQTVALAAGGSASVSLTLAAIPDSAPSTVGPTVVRGEAPVAVDQPLTRFGAIATANIDVAHKGAAAVVGLTVELVPHLEAELAALLGPTSGAYAGARVTLLGGKLHPLITAGVPLFVSSGARVSIRGAVGVEIELARRIALVVEAGVEHVFNPEMDVVATVFVPAIGLAARF